MFEYRKELDGLRALAVIPVVIYHAKLFLFGRMLFPGGFFGVDVFFVLSGFLITSILMIQLSGGNFSILSFYERRARRIMPALFAVIFICVALSYILLLPDALTSFYKSLVAVSLFCSNIFFSFENNYFSPNVDLKPLLHTWSLAVEEQYYLAFPLLLALLWKRGKKFTITALFLILISSFAFASYESLSDKNFSFYSIFTRCWELLIGAISAVHLHNRRIDRNNLTAQCLSSIGLLMIFFSMIFIDNTFPHPSWPTLLPTLGSALVIIYSSPKNLVGKVLSFPVFVFIGVLSYSIYLWHHPIFAFTRNIFVGEPGQVIKLSLLLLTLILSYLSWKYIESPFRGKGKFSRKFIFSTTAVITFVFIALGVLGVKTNILSNTNLSNETFDKQITFRLRGNYGLSQECEKSFANNPSCQLGDKPEVILWGDSFAMHLAKGIITSNPEIEMVQATVSQCAPILGLASTSNVFGAENCIQSNNKVLEKIKATKSIKYAVLASPFLQMVNEDMYLLGDGKVERIDGEGVFSYFLHTIDTLKSLGVKVTVVAPPPEGGFEIGMCLHKIKLTNESKSICDFPLEQMPPKQKQLYKMIKSLEGNVNVIWLYQGICPNGLCHSSVGDVMMYRDYGHLSFEGSEELGRKMDFYKLITK